jgi:hypothetical protein
MRPPAGDPEVVGWHTLHDPVTWRALPPMLSDVPDGSLTESRCARRRALKRMWGAHTSPSFDNTSAAADPLQRSLNIRARSGHHPDSRIHAVSTRGTCSTRHPHHSTIYQLAGEGLCEGARLRPPNSRARFRTTPPSRIRARSIPIHLHQMAGESLSGRGGGRQTDARALRTSPHSRIRAGSIHSTRSTRQHYHAHAPRPRTAPTHLSRVSHTVDDLRSSPRRRVHHNRLSRAR